MHHISNPAGVIAEVSRILKPNGRLIIAEFDKHADESMRRLYGDQWLGFSEHETISWLQKNRFEHQTTETYKLTKLLKLNIFHTKKQGG